MLARLYNQNFFMVKDHSFTEKKFQISGGERTGKWGNQLLQAFFF